MTADKITHPSSGYTQHHCFLLCFRLFNGWSFWLCLSKHLVYLDGVTGGSQIMGRVVRDKKSTLDHPAFHGNTSKTNSWQSFLHSGHVDIRFP